MTIGFFLVVTHDVAPFLHASSLVREAHRHMPHVKVVQLTDDTTAEVPDVDRIVRLPLAGTPLLEQRLIHYSHAAHDLDWLFLDTDVSIRQDARVLFRDPRFEVAVTDRNWPHLPQGEAMLHTMPYNNGVLCSRTSDFWKDVLEVWQHYSPDVKADWMSDQQAVYEVVKSGSYRVKILPGQIYNYPPSKGEVPSTVALAHYKGPQRKADLTAHAYQILGGPCPVA